MSNWRDYFKKKRDRTMLEISKEINDEMNSIVSTSAPVSTASLYPTTVSSSSAAMTPWYSAPGMARVTAAAPAPSTIYSTGTTYIGSGGFTGVTFAPPVPSNIITLSNNGKEIVRVNNDGSVTWNNEIDIDEAAEAFGKSLGLGAEISAGITKRVKLQMRDSVFEDLINIAKEKGSLTAEDLTYLLQASKIVEKLKGRGE